MPTNAPIPTVSTGGVIAAGTQNDMAVLNNVMGLFGVGNALVGGTPPAANAPNWEPQAGLVAISFTAGAGTLTFPVPFSAGVLCVLLNIQAPASTTSATCSVVNGGTFSTTSVAIWGALNGSSLTGFYNVHYVAIGW